MLLLTSEQIKFEEGKMNCPACNSNRIKKNGSIHNGKQKYMSKDYNRQFVRDPQNKIIPKETW